MGVTLNENEDAVQDGLYEQVVSTSAPGKVMETFSRIGVVEIYFIEDLPNELGR